MDDKRQQLARVEWTALLAVGGSPLLSGERRHPQDMPSFPEMAAPTIDDLHDALAEVVRFMERESLPYADDVRRALDEVAHGDAHGARRYLAMNRALLDIYFSPVNGNASSESEGERLTSRWRELHHHAFTLADALLRASR